LGEGLCNFFKLFLGLIVTVLKRELISNTSSSNSNNFIFSSAFLLPIFSNFNSSFLASSAFLLPIFSNFNSSFLASNSSFLASNSFFNRSIADNPSADVIAGGIEATGAIVVMIAGGIEVTGAIEVMIAGGIEATGAIEVMIAGSIEATGAIEVMIAGGIEATGAIEVIVAGGIELIIAGIKIAGGRRFMNLFIAAEFFFITKGHNNKRKSSFSDNISVFSTEENSGEFMM